MGNELVAVAGSGTIEKINFLLKNGANINFKNSFGITPLIAAKIAGRDDVVQLLLKNGAKETIPFRKGPRVAAQHPPLDLRY